MKEEYDFTLSVKNPYIKKLNKQKTMLQKYTEKFAKFTKRFRDDSQQR